MNLSILTCRSLDKTISTFLLQSLRSSIILLLLSVVLTDVVVAQRSCVTSAPVVSAGVISETETNAPLPDVITIPVVVHVVFHSDNENISTEQVKSQIAVLNNDFRMKNSDAAFIPNAFKGLAADSRIEFKLATFDPHGAPTSGITRKYTDVTMFGADDKVKFAMSGGTDAWDRDKYLNIWVCNLGAGVMGYASTPGSEPATDGVVIRYSVFGTTSNVAAPFNKGRTTVHETGHWLGLRHIWGDTDCGDDRIDDTPPQSGPTRGCPSGILSSCTSGEAGNMYMNFMDFTNDECTNMFTHGQAAKMRGHFSQGGARVALLSSDKANGAAVEEHVAVNTQANKLQVFPNPAVSHISITFPEGWRNSVATIYNQSGQAMKTILLNKTVTQVQINEFKAGIYYLSTGSGKAYRFVKAG